MAFWNPSSTTTAIGHVICSEAQEPREAPLGPPSCPLTWSFTRPMRILSKPTQGPAVMMDTYGHLFPDAEDLGRGAIDAIFAMPLTEQGRNQESR